MDGKKVESIGGNIVIMDTAKSTETRGTSFNPANKGAGEQEKLIIGEVMSISPFLLEDGRWMDTPFKVGEYVVYNIHAGTANVWQSEVKGEGAMMTGIHIYRIVKWTEILGKYNA